MQKRSTGVKSPHVTGDELESGKQTLYDYDADKLKKIEEGYTIDKLISDNVLADRSDEAKLGRRRTLYKAVIGEFMCTLLFYTPIFCTIAHATQAGWAADVTTLIVACVAGFEAVSISFAFSNVSGAQFNSAVSFALWGTGKLSNRRFLAYLVVQAFASIMAMAVVSAIFQGDLQNIYDAIAVVPVETNFPGKVFAEEFILTFFLVYVIFTVAFEDAEKLKKESLTFKEISDRKGLTVYASTPQSKTGFAPFSIGFTIFALANIGGTSGAAFNPGRLLGPAIFSGKWTQIYIYWLAEFLGGLCAGLFVTKWIPWFTGSGELLFPSTLNVGSGAKSTEMAPSTAPPLASNGNTNNPLRFLDDE